MARRRSALYLDGAPEAYNPFAVPLGPYAERVTGRKTTAKQKGDKPRDLSVKVKPKAAISRPNQGYVRRAEQAVSRAVPALEPFVQDVEGLLGPAEFEDALSRALPTLFGQDVYRGNADLAGEDASLFAINALAGPALGLAGKGIKKVAGMVPASVREGASDLAARAGRYLRDVPGGALRDADYVEGVFNVLPEGVSDFAVQPSAASERLARAREQGYNVDLPLYHGSSSDFDVFSPDRSIFLTDRPDIADIYAFERAKDKTRKYGPRNINADPNVRPVYARMANPLTINDQGPDGSHGWSTDNLAAALGVETSDRSKMRGRALYDEALRQGYDLVKIENMLDLGGEQSQYIPLKPEYVKSWFDRFDEQGTRKARGGLAVKRKTR